MNKRQERRIGLRARFGAVLALLVSGLVLGAGPALAHDALDETNPKDGATVKRLPAQIELVFNNDPLALGSVVRVESPEGDVTQGKPKIVDNVLTQAIAPGSPAGEYNVQWRVTSSDGHPIDGEFSFTAQAGNTPEATVPPTETADAPTTPAAEATTTNESAVSSSGSATSDEDDGGTSPILIITLIVLAVLVIAAAVYVLVIAPKRSGES